MEKNAKLKYPIVLVHGIGAIDRTTLFDFWGRIPVELRKQGIEVFFGNTDSWGDYKSNAALLKKRIKKILRETKKDKVNIIAHSKGGIDSRYLIWQYKFGDKVASLITISTPHQGAELADLVLKLKPIHSIVAKKVMKMIGKLFLDRNPDPYKTLQQISTENMKSFNETVLEDKNVYYKSLYTIMNNSSDDFMFFFTHWYLKKIVGRNDGVVSEKSAAWGNNSKEIKGYRGGISHAEIVDIKKKKISGIDIPDIYKSLVDELGKKGF